MRGALRGLAGLVWAGAAGAQPVFVDAGAAFPVVHVYSGGWEHFVGGGVAVFDCNGDARPDIFAAGGAGDSRLFVNRAAGADLRFDVGGDIPALMGVTGAYPLDVDGDGVLDIAVLRVGPNVLLRGTGDCRFEDAGAAWGFHPGEGWSTAFGATWEAGNAWPTMAIGNYVDRAAPDGPFGACDANELHRPQGTRYAAPVLLEPGYCALSMLFSDWQRSGTPELRISNDRHYYLRGGHEQMWTLTPLRERGDGDGWQRVSIWGMGIASADLQGDGYPDVMLTSMGDQVLMWNEGGELRAADYATGATAHRPHVGDDGRPSTGWHAEFGDVDNDGRADLFIAKGNVDQMPGNAIRDPNSLLMGRADGTFAEVAGPAGLASTHRARGAALADFDGDGRLDVLVVNRRAPMELWRNVTPDAGRWVAVDLATGSPNRNAIGAWLEIDRGDGRREWRERTVGGGHASGAVLPFHIGLGAAQAVRLRGHWPGGAVGDWVTVAAGARVTLRP